MSQPISETLIKAGFEPIVADIYLILINNGELSVPQILEHTTLSRASVYEALPELLAGGYIEYRKEGRQAFYKPAHPNQLASLVEQKKRDVALLDGEMGETIRALVGSYNLSSNKPGVRFFEGEEGIKELLETTLTHNIHKEIFSFTDLAGYASSLGDWNSTYYAPKRKELGISLKGIVPDDEASINFLKNYKANEVTEVQFINHKQFPLFTEINIYENSVSFVTFEKDLPVGVLIENEAIARSLKSIFLYAWSENKEHLINTEAS